MSRAESLLQRAPEWERLRELLARVQRSGLGSLSEAELWELPSLYRKSISDLSLLRSRGGSPQLEQELTHLCNSAHGVIYQGATDQRRVTVLGYLWVELPRTVRRRSAYILVSAAIMTLFAVIGWVHVGINRPLAESVLSPQLVGGFHASLRAAREMADLRLAAQIPVEERMGASVQITLNNIGVSIRAFLFGIFGGVLTIIILAFNGYLLGVIAYLYWFTDPGIEINLPLYFIAGIAPHGGIELPSICLAGAGGMLLGFSWVFPGARTRGAALREAATDAWRLLVVTVLTLLVAGAIEGFITPLLPPWGVPLELWFWFKIVIGLLVLAAWLAWLLLGGRETAPRRKEKGRLAPAPFVP